MPIYTYQARDLEGNDHKGSIETSDESNAAKVLLRKGLVVTSLKEQKDRSLKALDKIFNKVSFDDLVISTRQLATMIDSGLVLSEAIDILSAQQASRKYKSVLEDVSRDIKSGLDLASSFRKHPDVYPPLYISLVRAGEQAGNLDVILNQLATTLEKDREFRGKIKGALIYPVMVCIMMVGVMLIMLIFVVPRLTSLYTQSNIDLPLPTKILIFISNGLVNFWWLLLLLIVGGGMLFKQWYATENGKYKTDQLMLKIPVLSKVITGTSLTNFTRTFGLLTTAGVPILDSLKIVKDVIGNSVYKKGLETTYKGVERGLTLSAQLDSVAIFPKIVSQMFRVGEETGKVDKVSFKMADYFESETDHLVKNLTVIIEPLILIVLGIGVAFLVLSIILPIYKLTTSIS